MKTTGHTFNYNRAKFFVSILATIMKLCHEIIVKNSTHFVKEILPINFNRSFHMASFDIKSLLPDLPLNETIEICVQQAVLDSLIPNDITTSHFRSLLKLTVKESVFVFNNKLYKQVDGVAVGLPLSPSPANVFQCFEEKYGSIIALNVLDPLRIEVT